MQNIGLMMTYNEDDIIEETLTENRKHFDKVLVLDGSTDRTEEILRSFDHVVYLLKDQDLVPRRRIRDGARQFLLEEAQRRYGTEGWFTILHGDEIMVDDPNEIARRAEKAGAEKVNWHSLSFYWHLSQKDQIFDPQKRVQDQVLYYQPGSLEIRQFKNKPGIFYNLNQVNNILPQGIGAKMLFDFPIFKHYIVRSPQQLEKRPLSGFCYESLDKTEIIEHGPHSTLKEKWFENLKEVRKYDGDFKEFEPGKRPSFVKQWLNWRRYT